MTTRNTSSILLNSRLSAEPKHARLRKDLLLRIRGGDFKPGDDFATERDLIQRYGISSTTARRCLNDLARDGLLVRRRGSGTYVSETALLQVRHAFGVVCSSFAASLHTGFQTQLLTGLERNVHDLDGRMVLMTTQGFDLAPKPGLALAETVRQHAYAGLFIISPLPECWIRDLYDSALPLVSINVDFPNVPLARILTDSTQSIRRAFDHLFGLGHRRIAFVLGRTPGVDEVISSAAQFAGLELQKIQAEHGPDICLTRDVYSYGDSAGLEDVLVPLFSEEAATRPTAVVVFENSAARTVERKARSAGWTIPGDLSIMTCEAGPFSAVEPHMENLCWRAARIMEGLTAGHPPVRLRETVGCDLVVRASTAPPHRTERNVK